MFSSGRCFLPFGVIDPAKVADKSAKEGAVGGMPDMGDMM
jgi:hypothetical protein